MDAKSNSKATPDPKTGSAHWSSERLHADAQRAVGGCLNLIREVSRISAQIEPSQAAERLIKRALFMGYELQSRTQNLVHDLDKLRALNDYMFTDKRFRCVSSVSLPCADSADLFRLETVLSRHVGAPLLIELLYAFLAERIGVALEFADLKPTCFLKWTENGTSRFIDVSRQGALLSTEQLLQTLHDRFRLTTCEPTRLLETYSFEHFITDYLLAVKSATNVAHNPEVLLFLQDTLISYQPSNLQYVGERAILHRRLGNFKSALGDLKRYFAFHDRCKAPPELVFLYDEMLALMSKKN